MWLEGNGKITVKLAASDTITEEKYLYEIKEFQAMLKIYTSNYLFTFFFSTEITYIVLALNERFQAKDT